MQPPKRQRHQMFLLPRRAVPLVWAVLVSVILILLPWGVAQLGPRFGWSEAAPGKSNLAGLVPVLVGLALYSWCLAMHFRGYLPSVHVSLSPPHLVVAGPYKFSRNPMYVSGLVAWFGWTIYYGSPVVMGGLLLLWAVFAFRVIPLEERRLESLFGAEYLEYKQSVHRWIGRF